MKTVLSLYLLLITALAAHQQHNPHHNTSIASQFKQHDTDSDELLTKEQLTAFISTKLKQQTPEDTPGFEISQKFYQEAFVSYLLRYDKNQDGLNMSEFEQMLKKELHSEHKKEQAQQQTLL